MGWTAMGTEATQNPAAGAPSRRSFFWWLTAGMSTVAAVAAGIPFLGYFLSARKRGEKWIPLGPVSAFPVDETRLKTFENPLKESWDGMTANTGVYVRNLGKDRDQDRFLVLAVNCAHLGCPVSWFSESGLFMCPCHGGVYYATGERASGPPPRGLFSYIWRVRDGQLEIRAPHYPTLQDTLDGKPA